MFKFWTFCINCKKEILRVKELKRKEELKKKTEEERKKKMAEKNNKPMNQSQSTPHIFPKPKESLFNSSAPSQLSDKKKLAMFGGQQRILIKIKSFYYKIKYFKLI